ncbi:MAG: T9SS type A sorting domain-containing protein [Bacteroidales bacterium]|nr:T9SS type A sorting domain-containing protein [Bacteroidales bacterium]
MHNKFKILFIALLLSIFSIKAQTPLTVAPNFNVLDARGNYHDLYGYLDGGKYVLLDFFYNECLVCQTHVPEVNEAFFTFGCNYGDVIFLGINMDNTDGEVVAFESEYEVWYPNVSGIDGGGNAIVSLFQIPAFPTLVLIAPNRSIPLQDIWPLTAVNIIDELLNIGIDSAACPFAAINKFDNNSSVYNIYPSPAKEYIHLDFSTTAISDVKVVMTDFTGRIILEENYNALNSGNHHKNINMDNIADGMYFISIYKNGLKGYSQKIVKRN